MNQSLKTALLTSALVLCSDSVLARSQSDWTLGVGYATVNPKSDNGSLAGLELDVDSDKNSLFTFEYFIWDNIGLKVLAATPFKHDFDLGDSATESTEHLPPTLSLNCHFPTQGPWDPYIGAGLN